jgi:hypothetical protein
MAGGIVSVLAFNKDAAVTLEDFAEREEIGGEIQST